MSRLARPGWLAVTATSLLALAAATCAPHPSPQGAFAPALPASTTRVTGVKLVALTVGELDPSVAFFRDVLGFELVGIEERAGAAWEQRSGVFGMRARAATMRLGAEMIELVDYLAPRGLPLPWDTRADDHWFQHLAIVVRDLDAAYDRLRENGVEHASSGPQCLPRTIPTAAGICAFYFRDPDGHFLELIEFPPGKGDRRWHQPGGALFLGIDHTAIVVADTARSLRFYAGALGFAVAGESMNAGTEQEHLNNVEGARLRITTLRAPSGPGIELLEYLSPRRGRRLDEAARPNDLSWWQVRVGVPGAASPGLLRDPDGHALELAAGP